MKRVLLLAIMIPLMFGFLLWGSGSSGSGSFVGVRSATKVVAPSFLNFGGSAAFTFTGAPFRPAFQPIRVNAVSSFRWNFFDP